MFNEIHKYILIKNKTILFQSSFTFNSSRINISIVFRFLKDLSRNFGFQLNIELFRNLNHLRLSLQIRKMDVVWVRCSNILEVMNILK